MTEIVDQSGDGSANSVVLFVDDEPNILAALKRLFRGKGYIVHTAESAAQAVNLLELQSFDLVVSDMRMPVETGAVLMAKIKERWPDTMRVILTGYADVNETMQAINSGEIFRYVMKPWSDNELINIVQDALDIKRFRDEKVQLEAVIRRHNDQLLALNESLENRVRERTTELQRANESLKKTFVTSIKVFTSLIEMRGGALAGHSRQVADLARALAKRAGMTDVEAQEVMVAGLLHDIGKLGLPDNLIKRPYSILSPSEKVEFQKHAVNGQAALMALEQMHKVAVLIRHHHERYDGKGYPDQLAKDDIPLGARVLALANDFDALQIGTLEEAKLSRVDAIRAIIGRSGKNYDPQVVEAFVALMTAKVEEVKSTERMLHSNELKPNMQLARDLVMPGGVMLLAKDFSLDARLIEQIRQFEKATSTHLKIYIYQGEAPD